MKKLLLPLTLFVLAAMALAACSSTGAPATVPTSPSGGATTAPTAGTLPTTAATSSPAATGTTAATAAATSAATAAATNAPTTAAQATAPAATATAGTTGGAASPTGTPLASSGGNQSNGQSGQFVRLTQLMNANVTAKDNSAAGKVNGVLVSAPVAAAPSTANSAAGTSTTATPGASAAAAGGTLPVVRYVLVNTTGTGAESTTAATPGHEVLIPWQVFAFSGNPVAASVTVNTDVLARAPHVTLTDVAGGSVNPNTEIASYWSGQGISIPATGPSSAENAPLVLIPSQWRSLNVTDAAGAVLGPVSDIMVNASTGELSYIVFNGGQAFNNQNFVIPMQSIVWGASTGTVPGGFALNFDLNALKNAPFLQDLNQLPGFLNGQLNNFFNTLPTLPAPTGTPSSGG